MRTKVIKHPTPKFNVGDEVEAFDGRSWLAGTVVLLQPKESNSIEVLDKALGFEFLVHWSRVRRPEGGNQ